MYNPQLETFLRVADAGSFNKAAESGGLITEITWKAVFTKTISPTSYDRTYYFLSRI